MTIKTFELAGKITVRVIYDDGKVSFLHEKPLIFTTSQLKMILEFAEDAEQATKIMRKHQ